MLKFVSKLVCGILLFSTFSYADTQLANPALLTKANAEIINLPDSFDDSTEPTWDKLDSALQSLNGQSLILQLQGYGGQTMMGSKFIRSLMDAQKQNNIIVRVIGPTYSMHAFVACYADTLIMEEGSSLMFHAPGTIEGIGVPYFNVIWKNSSGDISNMVMEDVWYNKCKEKGLLTEQNIKDIKNGKDVTIVQLKNMRLSFVSDDPENYLDVIIQLCKLLIIGSVFVIFVKICKKI